MPLKLTRRHGSPFWYIRGSIRGVRVDESTGCGERRAAEQVLIKRGAEVQHRAIHGDRATRTFAEAALSYLLDGGEAVHLDPILEHFGPRTRLAQVGQAEIDEAAARICPGRAPATLNRRIYTPISAVLHHAARKGWCAKPVIGRPKQPKGRVRWITHQEADRLIEEAGHLRPLVVFLLSTGARISEALYLDWRQVDLARAHVVFLDTKNDEDRGVPLHPRAVAELRAMEHREGAVFRTADGEPYERRQGGGGMVKTAWRGMCKRAKITDFTPHDCRHTWATWHYAENRDIAALMQLGGWKSVEMVMRYAHMNASHLAPSIARMWGKDGDANFGADKRPANSAA